MRELELYKVDYENIITTVLEAYQSLPLSIQCNYCKVLYKSLTSERTNFIFEEQDLRQQLSLIWIELVNKFNKNKPRIHLRQYLIKCSSWIIRDWFKHQMLTRSNDKIQTESFPLPFTLDVNFLLNGTNYFPLNTITPYERYLLYLQYKEEKNISQIAYIVQHDRLTITRQMHILASKLVELKQEGFYKWQQRTKQI